MILQRAGHDLRRAGRSAIYQHHEWKLRPNLGGTIREVAIRITSAAAHADDPLSWIQEEVGHGDPLIEKPARVSAQVEDQRTHAGAPQ